MLQAIVVVTLRPNVQQDSDTVVGKDKGSDSSVGTGTGSDSSAGTDKVPVH